MATNACYFYLQEIIRRRAYELYEERMRRGIPAHPSEDWYNAEREIFSQWRVHEQEWMDALNGAGDYL